MTTTDFRRRANLAYIAQRLSEPASAILGYQELIVEAAREAAISDALPDLERVLVASRSLSEYISSLLIGDIREDAEECGAEAALRHDLRTPLNGILGYSELILEEYPERLPEKLKEDIRRVVEKSQSLLNFIDEIVAFSGMKSRGGIGSETDATVAADLTQAIAERSTTEEQRPGRILIVDDTESSRSIIAKRLQRNGHEVLALESAQTALVTLETEVFDLILLDVMMPEMNGIAFLARLKRDSCWRDIPVIMISGLDEDEAVLSCIKAGAEDYLTKPVDPILLRARINACLERSRWREREKLYLAEIERQRERGDRILNAVLPQQIIRRLAGGEVVIADRIEAVTILFADVVNFTELASRTSASALVGWLGGLFSRFDEIADSLGVEKIKTIGDAYMAASGLPNPRPDHAEAAIALGKAMLVEMDRRRVTDHAPELRVGIHTGPVVAGVIGQKRFLYDVWGHTVNLASRLESQGVPGRIQTSESTLRAAGFRDFPASPREVELKGIGKSKAYILS